MNPQDPVSKKSSIQATLARKFASLLKYRRTFIDWPKASLMRYTSRRCPHAVRLRMRGGGALWMRPQYDGIAMGEIFIAESYGELLPRKPPRRVWDIGGNIGCFAIWLFRRQCGAHITSFEPCAETFAVLSKNRDEWSNQPWEIRPYGLADRDQSVAAFVPFGSYGETSRHVQSGIPTNLPLRDISTVWEEEGRPSVDLMKIDCEGDEYEIVAAIPDGLWAFLENIIMEVHPRRDKNPEELRAILAARGFLIRQGKVNPELWLATRSEARRTTEAPLHTSMPRGGYSR